jgi:hypothetical protein
MVLGGLIKIDLLECEPHISTPHANHIRITAFTNLPCHITSAEKAMAIFEQDPIEFIRRRSSVEVCVKKALGNQLLTALDLDVTSTGNSARNTIEIVFAGLGFVAIGGNFATCKVRVSTPGGRGTGIRKPVVDRIGDEGCCLPVVRRRGVIRPVKIKKGGGLRVDIGDGVETSV